MTLILTSGHFLVFGVGAVVATVLMAVLASTRIAETRARVNIQKVRAECRLGRLTELQGHYREVVELQGEVRAHLKRRLEDVRTIASFHKMLKNQKDEEIGELNLLVTGAGEKLAGVNNELADWKEIGLDLYVILSSIPPDFWPSETGMPDLVTKLGTKVSFGAQPIAIEEIPSDEEAGPEDDTRELETAGA